MLRTCVCMRMSSAPTGFTRQIYVAQVNRSDCAWMRVCDSKIDLLNIENHEKKKRIGDITHGPVACAPSDCDRNKSISLYTRNSHSRCWYDFDLGAFLWMTCRTNAVDCMQISACGSILAVMDAVAASWHCQFAMGHRSFRFVSHYFQTKWMWTTWNRNDK